MDFVPRGRDLSLPLITWVSSTTKIMCPKLYRCFLSCPYETVAPPPAAIRATRNTRLNRCDVPQQTKQMTKILPFLGHRVSTHRMYLLGFLFSLEAGATTRCQWDLSLVEPFGPLLFSSRFNKGTD